MCICLSDWRSWQDGMGEHILTDDQRKRVEHALNWTERDNKMDCVKQMQSAEEFHQYVLNYNCNDGALPLFYIIKSPECDLGTALLIYWLHEDFLHDFDDDTIPDESEHDWNQMRLIKLIEARVLSEAYTNKNIRFSPMAFLGWTDLAFKRKKIQWGEKWPFPKIMLETSPGEEMTKTHIS